jgi:hypothetical protein
LPDLEDDVKRCLLSLTFGLAQGLGLDGYKKGLALPRSERSLINQQLHNHPTLSYSSTNYQASAVSQSFKMKFTASVVFALFSAATLVSGNPVPEAGAEHDVSLEVRGHGCPWSSNQCAFHVSPP